MSNVTRTQTRNPGKSLAEKGLDWENRHYCKVQVSEPGKYTSPLQNYLDAESPTKPGEPMYKVTADGSKKDATGKDRVLAGGPDMVLLECSKEDLAHVMRFGHEALAANGEASGWEDAINREKRVEEDTGDKYEQLQGGVLTG